MKGCRDIDYSMNLLKKMILSTIYAYQKEHENNKDISKEDHKNYLKLCMMYKILFGENYPDRFKWELKNIKLDKE